MSNVTRVFRFLGISVGLLLAWSGVASAGAPIPVPVAAGLHKPEHQLVNIGELRFESGAVVKDFRVSYVTYGKVTRNKDNVVLAIGPFGADHHASEFLIGPGKALDTEKYFVVATDGLGNSLVRQELTTGPTNSGLKMDFPRYTFRDAVNVEYKLLKEYLGFDHVLAVVGISTGALKAWQFGVSYPAYMSGIIPIAGGYMADPYLRTMMKNWMAIIALDGGWQGGNYETNPTTALLVALMDLSASLYPHRWFEANMKTPEDYNRWRKMWYDIWTYYAPQDARDVYYVLQAYSDFTIGDSAGFKGDVPAALRSIKADVLMMGAKEDQYAREMSVRAKSVVGKATYIEFESPFGHFGCCGVDPEATKVMDREITRFLSKLR